jgi:predicted nucleic acid-binding protein
LQYGAYNSKQIQNNLNKISSLSEIIQIVLLSKEITDEYARIKARLRKLGVLIDDFDILIGATAIVDNLVLVTNNEQHFNRIDGLMLENWT